MSREYRTSMVKRTVDGDQVLLQALLSTGYSVLSMVFQTTALALSTAQRDLVALLRQKKIYRNTATRDVSPLESVEKW